MAVEAAPLGREGRRVTDRLVAGVKRPVPAVPVDLLRILLGAIGGMIMSGIIGLFVGAVVLAVAYQLMVAWLEQDADLGMFSTTGAAVRAEGDA